MIAALLKAVILIATLVLPVMLAARLVKAGQKNFWPALLSTSLQIVFLSLLSGMLHSAQNLVMIFAVVGGSLIHSLVLKTTLLKGFFIGTIAIIGAAILQFTILAGSYAVIASAT